MNQFNIGDLVQVTDIGLAQLRAIMPGAPPNHFGAVADVQDDGATVLVLFPIGDADPSEHSQAAPYDVRDVLARTDVRPIDDALKAAALAYLDDDE